MMADGFTWVVGRGWIRAGQLTTADVMVAGVSSTSGATQTVQSAAVVGGGSVLGFTVPNAPAVLLPSFVGGNLGVIRMGGGMRPESGGTPVRIVMGPGSGVFPRIRMGVSNWGR